jgi:S-(hydroxymethyl)glutathione dehydrogenase/alcohol dehydrogenase
MLMASKSSDSGNRHTRPGKPSKVSVSRRNLLKQAAVAVGGGTATLLGGADIAGQSATASVAPTASRTGQRFRAFVRFGTGASVQELTLLPISPRQVVVRTEAAQICYSTTAVALATTPIPQAVIPGHGGVGTVLEIGSMVSRVQVGDRVIVAGGTQCGACYNCLHGRSDRCTMGNGGGDPNAPIAEMADGTRVTGFRGGSSELMVAFEDACVPVFTTVSSVELAMLHDVGMVGLAATMTLAPVQPGSDVCVLGAGPLGLSAVQGARIKGAARIVAVEPVKSRRDLALTLGATVALDPNVEGAGLVQRIQEICKGATDRRLAGGGNRGPDFVIEAVGGDLFPPKVEAGPDPTGILSLQQAWQLCSPTGHLVTTSIGHPQGSVVTFPANQWANGAKNHHPGNLAGAHSKRDLPRYIKLIEAGLFNAKALATGIFPLERTREAYEAAAYRTTVAAIVTI